MTWPSTVKTLKHIRLVVDRLRQAGLTVKPEKLVFATHEIAFLEHLVSLAGVHIDPERTRSIREFPTPRDTRCISRFIGKVNFYHSFTPRLHVTAPLNALRKKGVKFVWGQEQQDVFEALKRAISPPPVLRIAHFQRNLY